MLLQDCQKSRNSVRVDSRHYLVDPVFEGASYADRCSSYDPQCRRGDVKITRRMTNSIRPDAMTSLRPKGGTYQIIVFLVYNFLRRNRGTGILPVRRHPGFTESEARPNAEVVNRI